MLLPLEHDGDIKLLRIANHEQYCMVWEYYKTQRDKKKAGNRRMFGWQITKGDIPLIGRHEAVGFIT